MSQTSDAMKLAADTGMTLKEAWAQVKGKATPEAESAEERGTHKLASMRAAEEAW